MDHPPIAVPSHAPPVSPSTLAACVDRRERLLERLPPNAAVLLVAPPPARRNADVEHRYRQSSDLLYLTGFPEPDTVCLLVRDAPEHRFTLFVRPRDRAQETWTGRRAGVEGARATYGATAAYPIADLDEKLPELLTGVEDLYYSFGEHPDFDRRLGRLIERMRHAERRGRRPPRRLVDPRYTLHELRLLKTDADLALLRRAVDISREAHLAACRAARPGVREYEIEALIDYTFRRHGAAGPGYPTIVGAGANATILHYIENRDALRAGDLVLVDAGAEYEGYTADVTRTYPAGGVFTQPGRRIYEIVLRALDEATALVRPGATLDEIHARAIEVLVDGMLDLGLLEGTREEALRDKTYRRFYMHQTSHWLGMDVHDAGSYLAGSAPRPLAPGMVLTVEPGLYVPALEPGVAGDGELDDLPGELRGLGVRLEDDILVTAAGHEVLTAAIPRTVEAVEAAARG